MDISRGSLIQTSKASSWKLWGLTWALPTSHVRLILGRRWVSSCPTWSWLSKTWRNTLHLKYRYIKKRVRKRGIRHNSRRVIFSHLERLLSKMQFFSTSLFAFHLALVHFVDCPMTDCKCLDSHFFQGSGRQECSTKIQSLQLPKYYQSQTIYLYNANAFGWWLEPNSIQFGGFHS